MLFVLLVVAGAGWLGVVLHRDDIRKQEAHEENLARIREETAKTKEERVTAREKRAKEQRVEERWEKAAEQLWSDESHELIVAAAKAPIEDPAFGEAAVNLHRHLGGIFGDYFFPLRWTDSDHYLWRGFVVQLEQITAQFPPSAGERPVGVGKLQSVGTTTGTYSRTPRVLPGPRDMCRRCA